MMSMRSLVSSNSNLFQLLDSVSYCQSCATLRSLRNSRAPRQRNVLTRHASSLSSATAVNASKTVPPRLGPLHEALLEVQKKAATHVNLSRLQLALQGLESESPTVRLAVLGLSVHDTARRVIRLLLADALDPEEPWEKQLLRIDPEHSEAVLIRYGQMPNTSLPQSRTTIPVLWLPSSILQRNNLEILVTTVHAPTSSRTSNGATLTSDTFLSPMSGTPTAVSGRRTVISQPVYRSLLVVNGLDELLFAAQLLASTQFGQLYRKLVDLAVNLQSHSIQELESILVFDADAAEAGLAAIRTSIEKALLYEEKWVQSGLPALSRWLTRSSASDNTKQLSSPVRNLALSVLANAHQTILAETDKASLELDRAKISTATRANLEEAVDHFGRAAHLELQSGLTSAWSSRNWRKLAWYKLFWRVDDVGLIVADLISSAWLPATERSAYELSGRLVQAGISPFETDAVHKDTILMTKPVHQPSHPNPALSPLLATGGPTVVEPVLFNKGGEVEVAMTSIPQPKPLSSTISSARRTHINNAILELTATAQQLVFRTLSITGLTAGMSGLAYFSVTAGSIYEAGTIVALGSAFAARTMQIGWQRACKGFEEGLMDVGRSLIRHMEKRLHQLVREGGKKAADSFEAESRKAAINAVVRAQEILRQIH